MNPLRADRRQALAHRLRTPTAVGCLILALCACVPGAPHDPLPLAVEVPNVWSAPEASAGVDASSLAQWWLRFDDPLLESLITQALAANTSIRSAQAALQQARALRDVSAAALWPTVGSLALAQRSKSGGHSAVNNFKAGLDASWELDIFGANQSALDASDASALSLIHI